MEDNEFEEVTIISDTTGWWDNPSLWFVGACYRGVALKRIKRAKFELTQKIEKGKNIKFAQKSEHLGLSRRKTLLPGQSKVLANYEPLHLLVSTGHLKLSEKDKSKEFKDSVYGFYNKKTFL